MTRSTNPSPLATAAPQSFAQCLGYFLTPQVWKQAQQAVPRRRAWLADAAIALCPAVYDLVRRRLLA